MVDRHFGLILCLLVLPLLAQAQPPATPEKGGRYLVGFAQDTLDNAWRSTQVRELREAFSAHPDIRFVFTDARGRTAQQIRDFEDLADLGADLLITSPRDGAAMQLVVSEVYRRGIPVVLLTRRVPGDDYTSFISPDDHAIDVQAADLLAHHLNGKGRVLVLQGVPTASTTIGRTRGFQEGLSQYPEMTIVAMPVGNYLRADAMRAMEKVLADNIAFDAIFSESDSMAVGARLVLRAAGIDPRSIPLVGVNYIAESRDAIRSGEQLASFTYFTCGRVAVEQVVKILNKRPFVRDIVVESVLVTRSNVEEVVPTF